MYRIGTVSAMILSSLRAASPWAAGLCVAGLSVAGVCAAGHAADSVPRSPLRADDFYRLQTLTDAQVSPDGQWVAYIVTSNDREGDEARSALWMVSWDGMQRLALTTPGKGTSAPRWSPDGRYLAFIATPVGSKDAQIMLLDRRGGEPRALTHVTDEIGAYAWSPDGQRLVAAIEHGGAAGGVTTKPIVIDALHFKQDKDGYLGSDHGRRLYLIDVASQKIEALTGDEAPPGEGRPDGARRSEGRPDGRRNDEARPGGGRRDDRRNEDLPAWSPDGKHIAFIATRAEGPDADGMEDIDIVDASANAASTTVLRIYAPNHQSLQWSADGAKLVHLRGAEPKYNQYIQDRLATVTLADGSSRLLAQSLDRAVSSYVLTRDGAAHDGAAHDGASLDRAALDGAAPGDAALATIVDDGTAYSARIDLRSGAFTKDTAGPYVLSALSEAGGHVAVLQTNDTAPAEVYALEAGKLRALTAHNSAWLEQVQLGAVEDFRFKSRDGTEIHGLMVKPPAFVAGRRYPTILWIHGGPNGQDAHGLASGSDQFKRQLLAAQGFLVVGINYRGSSGRGDAFARAILADWGHKEVEDLMAGVDHLITEGLADPERLGIGGWSYGGILTDYTIAANPRFKAAVSGAGSSNVLALYGSDEYIIQYNNELGAPWSNTARWLTLSRAFLHADRIHTPTLFMGGDQDFDVPLVGGEQMYQALRTLGVPTQLVVYPGQYHTLTRPSFLKDRADRIAAWFTHYLTQGSSPGALP